MVVIVDNFCFIELESYQIIFRLRWSDVVEWKQLICNVFNSNNLDLITSYSFSEELMFLR